MGKKKRCVAAKPKRGPPNLAPKYNRFKVAAVQSPPCPRPQEERARKRLASRSDLCRLNFYSFLNLFFLIAREIYDFQSRCRFSAAGSHPRRATAAIPLLSVSFDLSFGPLVAPHAFLGLFVSLKKKTPPQPGRFKTWVEAGGGDAQRAGCGGD